MRSPGEVVPGSQDPGSVGLHRLPGGAVWRVTCAHTQALWRQQQQPQRLTPVSGVRSDRRGSRQSLIAVARASLWSLFRWRSESPLLAHRETKRQDKVSCLFGSCRLFPGLPPSQLWCANPFRLCSRRQPQSSPCHLTKAEPQLPAPPALAGEQTSLSGW